MQKSFLWKETWLFCQFCCQPRLRQPSSKTVHEVGPSAPFQELLEVSGAWPISHQPPIPGAGNSPGYFLSHLQSTLPGASLVISLECQSDHARLPSGTRQPTQKCSCEKQAGRALGRGSTAPSTLCLHHHFPVLQPNPALLHSLLSPHPDTHCQYHGSPFTF